MDYICLGKPRKGWYHLITSVQSIGKLHAICLRHGKQSCGDAPYIPQHDSQA